MKKAALSTLAAVVALSQFGCGWQTFHDVFAHVLEFGQTLDMFNIIP